MKDTAEAWLQPVRPQYFRLPPPGEADPHFGFSRSFFYCGEARGWWRLIRLCDEGKTRGITLICYDEVAKFLRERAEKGAASNSQFDVTAGDGATVEQGRPEGVEQ
jgi:hypothetical protein